MNEHYFTADPSSADERQQVSATVWGRELVLQSASGVFAAGRLDKGTAVLLRAVRPRMESRTFLDLGCGYGVIACALGLELHEAEIWAVDVNARARLLCQENAARLGVGNRMRVCAPEEVPGDVSFDEIWSDPPIHVGKPALHALLLEWLARLRPDGRAMLVVGKNLGSDSLQRWLDANGHPCRRVGSAKGFRVIECLAARTR